MIAETTVNTRVRPTEFQNADAVNASPKFSRPTNSVLADPSPRSARLVSDR
jgi:hypothetical protein